MSNKPTSIPKEETRLARKIWPKLRGLEVDTHGGRWDSVEIGNSRDLVLLFSVDHPRAREALRAALRVLAGEDGHG